MSDAKFRAIVKQHAETSRLMGVDFVPVYRGRKSGAAGLAGEKGSAAARSEPEAERKPAAKARAAAPREEADTEEVAKPNSIPVAALAEDRDRSKAQAELDALRRAYEKDAPHDAFGTTFTKIVFGEGDPCAGLCFVGEAPGEDEDLSGRPFVGRAGQLLDKMIVAMGLKREQVYICNVLKTRPPGNRPPTVQEVAACKPYLLKQLAIVRPMAVVALGLSATHALLDTVEPMARLRGRWWEMADATGRKIPLMPTYHPAFLLRSYTEENRRKVWSDLQLAMTRVGLRKA
jgi:DNA polymerase